MEYDGTNPDDDSPVVEDAASDTDDTASATAAVSPVVIGVNSERSESVEEEESKASVVSERKVEAEVTALDRR